MKASILLVDDDPHLIDIVVKGFAGTGYDIKTAKDGEEALRLTAEFTPDLILLDLEMPILDGWKTAVRLREDPRMQEIPIIALTTHEDIEAVVQAKKSGFDLFINKGIELNRLVSEVQVILDRWARRRVSDQEPAAAD